MNQFDDGKAPRDRAGAAAFGEDVEGLHRSWDQALANASRTAGRLDRQIVQFARSQPLVAAGAAALLGFVIGRVLSRRSY
jgi:hypothetical protein